MNSKTNQTLRKTTLAYLIREGEVLLAMKKKGFGQNKLNGIGGKVQEEKGETLEEALIRETMEEIGVKPLSWQRQAILKFFFPEAPEDQDWNQEVHVFLIDQWQGEPKESEEMRPKWTPINKIPYSKMWADDPYWFPKVLAKKNVRGEFSFNSQGEVIQHSVKIL